MICKVALRYDFVKVLDFGLAKFDRAATMRRSSRWKGWRPARPATSRRKSRWASRAIDGRADLYALGCVAYFLLTGTLVFHDPNPMSMALKHVQASRIRRRTRTELPIPRRSRARRDALPRPRSPTTVLRRRGASQQLLTACGTPLWSRRRREALVGAPPAALVVAAIVRAGRRRSPRRSCEDLNAHCLCRPLRPDAAGDGGRRPHDRASGRGEGGPRRRVPRARGPATALPAIVVMATAVAVVVAVPVYARLLARFGPGAVVPVGFPAQRDRPPRRVAVLRPGRLGRGRDLPARRRLRRAAALGLLVRDERAVRSADGARASYGRIAAAGTLGGLAGGLAAAQLAREPRRHATALLMLAVLHAAAGWASPCSVARRRRCPSRVRQPARGRLFDAGLLTARRTSARSRSWSAQHGRGARRGLSAEGAGASRGSRRAAACSSSSRCSTSWCSWPRFSRSRRRRPSCAGSGSAGRSPRCRPAWARSARSRCCSGSFPIFAAVRGIESVLRGSLFRSAYELLFVPMDPDEKRRTKTFLDVTCDRAGDAVGAGVVQVLAPDRHRPYHHDRAARRRDRACRGRRLYLAPARHAVPRRGRATACRQHGDATSVVVGRRPAGRCSISSRRDRPADTVRPMPAKPPAH